VNELIFINVVVGLMSLGPLCCILLFCYDFRRTASSCTSISSSCTSIIFKIPIIDMSKLQNYPCCYKRRFSMERVRFISEHWWKVSQWWWEVPTVLEWEVEGNLGGRRWLWVAEKQPLSSSSRYLLFIFSDFHGL